MLHKYLSFACLILIIGTSHSLKAQGTSKKGSGESLRFDGSDDYIKLPDTLYGQQGTISFWVKPNSVSREQVLIAQGDTTTQDRYIQFVQIRSNPVFRIQQEDDGGIVHQLEFGKPVAGKWQHVAVTSDGSQYTAYVNGGKESFTITNGTNTGNWFSDITNSNGCRFGINIYQLNLAFDGQIDEIRIWDRSLTQTEIRNHLSEKLTGNEPGLVGYWRFDKGSGSTANDASGNGNDGTLQ